MCKKLPQSQVWFLCFFVFSPFGLAFSMVNGTGVTKLPSPPHRGRQYVVLVWQYSGGFHAIVCCVISYPLQKTSLWPSHLMCSFQALLPCGSWMLFLATENLQHDVIWSDLISPWEFTVLSAIPEEFFVKGAVFMPSSGLCCWIIWLSFCHHWVWDTTQLTGRP